MAGIPALSSQYYRSYNNYNFSTTAAEQVNSLTPQWYNLNNTLSTLKNVSGLSVSNFQTQQADYRSQIADFSSAAKSLKSSVTAFDSTNNVFDRKYVSTGTAAVSGEAQNGATVTQYDVAVTQVAAKQRNTGNSAVGTSYGALAAGTYTLGITSGTGAEKQVAFSVSATDNNSQILGKISNAVNGAKTGVNASVKTTGNNSYLSFESQKTGAANSFSVRDISGNAVSALNLTNKTQTSADAKYTVNATAYQTDSNDVSLDNGKVNLKLNAATTGTVKVSVGGDHTKAVSAVRDLVNSYNQLNGVVKEADNLTNRGERLFSGVQAAMSGARANEFKNIGITMDKSTGEISLDESKFSQALQSNPSSVKRLLSGRGGLANSMANVAKTAENSPVGAFLKPPNLLDSLNNSYTSGQQSNVFSSMFNSPYKGLFLDTMI